MFYWPTCSIVQGLHPRKEIYPLYEKIACACNPLKMQRAAKKVQSLSLANETGGMADHTSPWGGIHGSHTNWQRACKVYVTRKFAWGAINVRRRVRLSVKVPIFLARKFVLSFQITLTSLSVQNIALNSQGFQDLSVSSPDTMTLLFKEKFLNTNAKLFRSLQLLLSSHFPILI